MSQTNSITIEGNLTTEPILRYTNAGDPVTNLRVAQTDSYVRNGERRESTEYFQVVVWGQQAENAAMSLATGNRVTVSGKLRQRTVDMEDGKRYFTELHADVVGVSLRWAIVDDIVKSTKNAPAAAPQPVASGGEPIDVDYNDAEEPF